jgi:uncharacterized protein YjbJ (UPF0337 family)
MTNTESKTNINKENWHEKKCKLKEMFPHLTDPDLDFEEGKLEEMIDKIHSKIGKTIGKTKEGLHKFIDGL